jgi:hypothetical protein
MTTNTITPATAAAELAEAARVELAASLTASKVAGTAVLVKHYGKGADTASVGLAAKAAAVMGGGAKPRGGAADRINKVIAAVADYTATHTDQPLTAAVFYTAARATLDAHKAAEAARRKANKDDRAAAKAVLNDRSANKADRLAALDLMSEIDEMPAAAKRDAVRARLTAALTAARDAGFTVEQVDSILYDVYPLDAAERIAA